MQEASNGCTHDYQKKEKHKWVIRISRKEQSPGQHEVSKASPITLASSNTTQQAISRHTFILEVQHQRYCGIFCWIHLIFTVFSTCCHLSASVTDMTVYSYHLISPLLFFRVDNIQLSIWGEFWCFLPITDLSRVITQEKCCWCWSHSNSKWKVPFHLLLHPTDPYVLINHCTDLKSHFFFSYSRN